MKYNLAYHDITVVLTSCGRLEQLSRTLEAFHSYYKPSRFILMEDKADVAIRDYCADKFPHIEVILNQPQLGQMASIDKAYDLVTSQFIFHLEDDWDVTGKNDIATALELLSKNKTISCICLRNFDYMPQKFQDKYDAIFESDVEFRRMTVKSHPEWFGHTFNPSLLKKSLWEEIGGYKNCVTEENLSLKMKKINKTVTFMMPSFFSHIGQGFHVHDPMQPQRKRNFWGRQKRSIEKRINRIKRLFEK